MELVRYLPKAYLSWLVGQMVHLRLPAPLARLSTRIFADLYQIDVAAATRPIGEYRSIGEFFTRDLRPELRPISGILSCPVDGTLRSCCNLKGGGEVTQVKGLTYSLSDLLGADECTTRFRDGQLWNFYLSPRDAHHIHAPVDGRFVKTIHLPGALWPVNTWALHAIPGLFAVNERVITCIESEVGAVAVVMVGATNVGRIKTAYMDLQTNRRPWRAAQRTSYSHPGGIPVRRGEKIGTFMMGSSVLIATEQRLVDSEQQRPLTVVQYGQPLAGERSESRSVGA